MAGGFKGIRGGFFSLLGRLGVVTGTTGAMQLYAIWKALNFRRGDRSFCSQGDFV